jgi:hypothetical protein
MDVQSLASHVGNLLEESGSILFASWAVRHRAGWDYKLTSSTMAVRWIAVIAGYTLASSLPGPPLVRMVPGFIAIAFLCWPNFAWHIMRPFTEWHVAPGHIVSVEETDTGRVVMYDFQFGDERLGGTAREKLADAARSYFPGQALFVRYDPLNPGQSKID